MVTLGAAILKTIMEATTDTREVSASVEALFGVVMDVERYPEWASDIRSVTVLERDDHGRPRRVHFRAGAFGRSAAYTLCYDTSGAPYALAWHQEDGDVTARLDGRYRFEPLGEGVTCVTYELTADLVVPLPGFLKRRAEMKIVRAALDDLARRVHELGASSGTSEASAEKRSRA